MDLTQLIKLRGEKWAEANALGAESLKNVASMDAAGIQSAKDKIAALNLEVANLDSLIASLQATHASTAVGATQITPPVDAAQPLLSVASATAAQQAGAQAANQGSPHLQVVSNGREHLPFDGMAQYFSAVRKASTGGERHPGLDIIHKAALERAAASGFNITLPGDGGFLIQQDVLQEIKTTVFEGTIFVQHATKLPLSSAARSLEIHYRVDKDRSGGSIVGGLKWLSASEAEAATAGKFEVRSKTLKLKKLTCAFYSTEEMERNLPAFVALIQNSFRQQLPYQLDKWAAYGNGVDEAVGMLNSKLNPALIVVDKVGSQTNGTLVYDNVNDMDTVFMGGPASLVHASRKTVSAMSKMSMPVGTGGVPVWLPASGILGQRQSALFGMPVMKSGIAKTLGQEGDIAFVDPAEYLWIDQSDAKFDASMHVRFLQGEMTYRGMYEADGLPSWYAPLKQENAELVSPYVVLEKRAA